MASTAWQGGAAPISQVNTWTFAGTWLTTETVTVTVGTKAVTVTTGSTTIGTLLNTVLAALQALAATSYPEFAEITWARPTSSTLTGTAVTGGKPFTATVATNSAAGTVNGGASSTGTATTASSGPSDWSTAANWTGGAVPTNGDSVVIDLEGARIYWGLNQSAVTLASLRVVAKDVVVGLPKTNADATAYAEYRTDFLRVGATSCYVRTAARRLKLDFGTAQTTYLQTASGTGAEQDVPPVLLKGTHASNAWTFTGGTAGCGWFAGDGFTALTLRAGGNSAVSTGSGATLGTAVNEGGTLAVLGAVTTLLSHPGPRAGTTTVSGSGAVAQIQLQSGRVNYLSTGALGGGGSTTVAGNATLSFDGDPQPKTVSSSFLMYDAASLFDSFRAIAGSRTIQTLNGFRGKLVLGPNLQMVVTSL